MVEEEAHGRASRPSQGEPRGEQRKDEPCRPKSALKPPKGSSLGTPSGGCSSSGGKRGGSDATDGSKRAKSGVITPGAPPYDGVDSAVRWGFHSDCPLWDDADVVGKYICDTGHPLDMQRLRGISEEELRKERNLHDYRVYTLLS